MKHDRIILFICDFLFSLSWSNCEAWTLDALWQKLDGAYCLNSSSFLLKNINVTPGPAATRNIMDAVIQSLQIKANLKPSQAPVSTTPLNTRYTYPHGNNMGFFSGSSHCFFDVGIMAWDMLLTLSNLVRRKYPIGDVTPEGHPGYGGHWPEFIPPQLTDSRCSCPAFNAMANHGIISRSGREVSFVELNNHIQATYNFSPTFSSFVLHFLARMLKRNFSEDTFDLEEIDLHNGIEHDASLLRLDAALQPDQSIKHVPFIEELLAAATGKDRDGNDIITTKDCSSILGKRRAVARAVNKEFSLSFFHKIFGSADASILVTIFGGRVDDLRSFLLHERIPERWESRVRQPHGMTIINFNKTVLRVEVGVREKDWAQAAREAAESHGTVTLG